jgi:hypothetical protein
MATVSAWWDRFRARAWQPTDAAALAAFRILFGLVGALIAVRFLAMGGVERFYLEPKWRFPYWGFEWVRPLPGPWMQLSVAATALAGVLVALGLFYRVAIVAFFLLFTYCELIDVTTYLNHYYLVSLLALLGCFLPLHRAWSLDAWRRPALASPTLPRWMTWLLRFQIGVVYLSAAHAKLTRDWLLYAQPLGIWLAARTDIPIVGPYLEHPLVAYAMSWGGFLYDLTIPFWLSWKKTRPWAYLVLLGFHATVGQLFMIGLFPLIMTTSALVFFSPSWPRTVLGRLGISLPQPPPVEGWSAPRPTLRTRIGGAAIALYGAFQLFMPLRAYLYGGNVLWHEQGMRWAMRVVCREKNGSVSYRVRARGLPREIEVSPTRYLTADQEREFAAQPDMILRLAHHIRDEYRARGFEDVEVRVDAFASLNGRPMARLIDPDVDLARVADSLAPATWILPAPEGPPLEVWRSALARAERAR